MSAARRPRRRPWLRTARGATVLVLVATLGPLAACSPDGDADHRESGGPASDHPATEAPAQAAPGALPPSSGASGAADLDEYAAGLLRGTQEVRRDEGLPPLDESACAISAARSRAAALVGAPLEHAPLDEVLAACDPPAGSAAENLSRTAADPAEVVDAWMASHGHRANLLDPTLTSVGIACAADPGAGPAEVVCAQVFLG